MSSNKKKKRPSAGDDLINSLFDDLSSNESSRENSQEKGAPKNPKAKITQAVDDVFGGKFELSSDDEQDAFTPVPQTSANQFVLGSDDEDDLSLEGTAEPIILDPVALAQKKHSNDTKAAPAKQAPPFVAGQPVVTQMASRPQPTVEPSDDLADFSSVGNSDDDQFMPSPELLAGETSEPKPIPTPAPQAEVKTALAAKPEPKAEAKPAPAQDDERTMRLVVSNDKHQAARPEKAPFDPLPTESFRPSTESKSFDRSGATEIRPGVKIPPAPKLSPSMSSAPGAFSSSEANLKQSESLRIAQGRITELERELERLRRDNESLSTAGDTLRRRADELLTKTESLDIQAREATHLLEEERRIMRGQLQAKDRDNAEMRARVEEIETRLESNFKKIRVRERELEHRLEIVKMESATLVSTKDKMILDLKRQIDQLTHEHDYAKTKTQELFNQYKDKQETQRRVVRALRIALTILEGDDETVVPLRKAE